MSWLCEGQGRGRLTNRIIVVCVLPEVGSDEDNDGLGDDWDAI